MFFFWYYQCDNGPGMHGQSDLLKRKEKISGNEFAQYAQKRRKRESDRYKRESDR